VDRLGPARNRFGPIGEMIDIIRRWGGVLDIPTAHVAAFGGTAEIRLRVDRSRDPDSAVKLAVKSPCLSKPFWVVAHRKHWYLAAESADNPPDESALERPKRLKTTLTDCFGASAPTECSGPFEKVHEWPLSTARQAATGR